MVISNTHLSQLSRGHSSALGQQRPGGVGGTSPLGQSSVRQPILEQSLVLVLVLELMEPGQSLESRA